MEKVRIQFRSPASFIPPPPLLGGGKSIRHAQQGSRVDLHCNQVQNCHPFVVVYSHSHINYPHPHNPFLFDRTASQLCVDPSFTVNSRAIYYGKSYDPRILWLVVVWSNCSQERRERRTKIFDALFFFFLAFFFLVLLLHACRRGVRTLDDDELYRARRRCRHGMVNIQYVQGWSRQMSSRSRLIFSQLNIG